MPICDVCGSKLKDPKSKRHIRTKKHRKANILIQDSLNSKSVQILDEYILKICVIGSPGANKTPLIRRYAENTFSEDYFPTLGVDITTNRIIVNNIPIKLIVMDIAGEEMFSNIRKSYFEGVAGCIIVYDVTIRESFQSLDRLIEDFRSNKDRSNTPIVIIGNNADLEVDRQVDLEEAREFAEVQGNVPFYECTTELGGCEIPEIYANFARQYLESVQWQISSFRC